MESFEKTPLNKMKSGPKRAHYDKALVNDILDSPFVCHIAYVFEDTSIVVPTGYGRKDDIIYLHGSIKNRMMLSLLKQEKVSITVTRIDGLFWHNQYLIIL